MIEFEIPGIPTPKARPRFTKHGHIYTPTSTTNAEQAVKWQAKIEMGARQPFTGPVKITVSFYLPAPKKLPSHGYPAKKPDLDNLTKLVLDGLNGICYEDDKQVVELTATKFYDDEPRTEITVTGWN